MGRRTRRRVAGAVALAVGLGLLAGCTGDEGGAPRPSASVQSGAVLDPWFEAVHDSGQAPARVVVLGDSVSEGYGLTDHLERRWVDRLQAGLRRRAGVPGCPTGPGGWHGTTSLVPADYRAASLPDPVRTGETVEAPTFGPGGRALSLGPGGAVTWTVEAESVDIGYRTRIGGGSLQVEIDGAVPPDGRSVPTDTDPEAQRLVWTSDDLGPGRHRVTVRNTGQRSGGSTDRVTVTDLTPHRGDRGRCVQVLDASRSGVSARTITQTPTYLQDTLSLEPDLLLVPLGFNDRRAGVTADDFGHTLDSLVQQTRGMGYSGPILLVGWFMPAPDRGAPDWTGYLRQMHSRTSHDGVSFLDLSAVLPHADPASRNYIDGLHPSADGQVLISDSLTEVLAPPAQVDGTSSPDPS